MPTFHFKNKKTLEFQEFPIDDKNLRKVNIVHEGKDSEGLWAAFSDEGAKAYDSDVSSSEYTTACILQNNALHFFPSASWGLYVPVKLNGGSRPVCDIADLTGKMIFCKERLEAEAEEAKKKKP